MVGGGQGGVGGGGEGGEVMEVNGFLGGKEEEEGGVEVVLWLLEWWRRWRRER